jgi:hypothetical protein
VTLRATRRATCARVTDVATSDRAAVRCGHPRRSLLGVGAHLLRAMTPGRARLVDLSAP